MRPATSAFDDDRPFPLKIFLFAFFGWTFDFYDLVLLGFLKEHVGHDLGLTHSAEAWMLGVALGTSGLGGIVAGALADVDRAEVARKDAFPGEIALEFGDLGLVLRADGADPERGPVTQL